MITAVNSIGDPRIIVLGPQSFMLDEPFTYQWEATAWPWQRLTIERGFHFDGASIPRLVHPFIGTWDLGLMPPLIHDALYGCKGQIHKAWWIFHEVFNLETGWVSAQHIWTRKESDRMFGRHMREAYVPSWRRTSAYRAVRLFGRGAWNHTPLLID